MTKILVTGSNGQLGSEIRQISSLFANFEFCFTDYEELDITEPEKVKAFVLDFLPDYLINCAAYTAVDNAETDIVRANLLNAEAVGILAKNSSEINCRIIHISTDYVFDGIGPRPYKETDKTNPQSAYGKTKLDGEILCEKFNSQSLIIRTSWLYSAFGANFVKTMLRLGKEKTEIGVISDQIGSPTNAADLASAILNIISGIEKGDLQFIPGIYHYSNEGAASWYDFTKTIFDIAGIKCNVKPIASEDFPSKVARPAYSIMSKSKIKTNFGIEIPYWRDSLKHYLNKKI